jgi:hypothetical protein
VGAKKWWGDNEDKKKFFTSSSPPILALVAKRPVRDTLSTSISYNVRLSVVRS